MILPPVLFGFNDPLMVCIFSDCSICFTRSFCFLIMSKYLLLLIFSRWLDSFSESRTSSNSWMRNWLLKWISRRLWYFSWYLLQWIFKSRFSVISFVLSAAAEILIIPSLGSCLLIWPNYLSPNTPATLSLCDSVARSPLHSFHSFCSSFSIVLLQIQATKRHNSPVC